MFEFAYSEICEELPSQVIPKPRRLPDAIELIEAVQGARSPSHETLGVLSEFRRLWLTIVEDFPLYSQDVSVQSRHIILSVADGVLQEIERCRFHKPEMRGIAFERGARPL